MFRAFVLGVLATIIVALIGGYFVLRNGIIPTGMPSWKQTLTDQQIWSLALFLEHMDKLPPAAEQAWQNVVN